MLRMHAGRAGWFRLCRLVCVATLAGQIWSVEGVDAQETVVGAPIRGAHIDALRAEVEAQAPECSSVFRWTDDPIVPGVTQVKADHIVELRRAINEIAQGQCPTLLEQVTFEGVEFTNSTSERNRVEGWILNSGSTAINGVLSVRIRFFDANNVPLIEGSEVLRQDSGDGNSALGTLGVQVRHPFGSGRWPALFPDSEIEGWSYFQVVAFEDDGRSVLCSGCNQRHVRQPEQVTLEGASFANSTSGRNRVEGWILNSGSTAISGVLSVRIRFFDANNVPLIEDSEVLRQDSGDGNSALGTLGVQVRHPFGSGRWPALFPDSEIEGWSYFQVAFEDDGRRIPCVGCDRQYRRPE